MQAAADQLGLVVHTFEARSLEEIEPTLDAFRPSARTKSICLALQVFLIHFALERGYVVPQNFIAAPGLKAPMAGFVVRIALRQHVPLRAGVAPARQSAHRRGGAGA